MDKKIEAIKRLIEIMDELRVKCPWDREQTMLSLRNNTIEECFELTDAILDNDIHEIRKELGDLLLHIVFYSKIAEEQNLFNIADVANGECEKLIYRHPHVFGETKAKDAEEVCKNWEALKRTEKDGNKTILSGVPKGMPSIPKAYRIQEKVANVGFDWEKKEDVWSKVKEEILEVEREIASKGDIEGELGDLLFSIVNVARLYGVNPDTALERTNRKFIRRFNYIEQKSKETNEPLKTMGLERMEQLWQEAKNSTEE